MKKNIKKKPELETFNNGKELLDRYLQTLTLINSSAHYTSVALDESSNELVEYGIYPNDFLIVQKTYEYEEGQLTLWYTRNTDPVYYVLGFAFDNFGDISVQKSNQKIHRFKKKEIELIGVVVGVVRTLDIKQKETPIEPICETIEESEITVVCDECKKELTASRAFIKAQGWRLRKNEILCLHCDL